jgi:hypothetical protein
LGILLAVICLVALTYGVVKVYQTFISGELTRAKNVLNAIESKQNILGEVESLAFSVQSPCTKGKCDSWYLLAWNAKDSNSPAKCTYKGCLCMCKAINTERCQNEGVCKKFSYDKITIKSEAGVLYDVNFPNELGNSEPISERSDNCKVIKFGSQLVELEISKVDKGLSISSSNSQKLEEWECNFNG